MRRGFDRSAYWVASAGSVRLRPLDPERFTRSLRAKPRSTFSILACTWISSHSDAALGKLGPSPGGYH